MSLKNYYYLEQKKDPFISGEKFMVTVWHHLFRV